MLVPVQARHTPGKLSHVQQSMHKACMYKEYLSSFNVRSRDKRAAVDPKQFTFDGQKGLVLTKQPGSISGQQFIIQNCQACTLVLLDHSATVTVDDCQDCNIVIGPCKGSVFIRDCQDCRMIIACQQYRTRDCKNMTTFLLCQTQPIIESSSDMRFACLQLNYDQFQDQLDKAGLSVFNNNWSKIHDFTPPHSGRNFSYSDEDIDQLEALGIKTLDEFRPYNLQSTTQSSLIPLTLGKRLRPSKEVCFCLLFPGEEEASTFSRRCMDMIKYVSEQEGCRLVATAQVQMTPSDVERLTGVKGGRYSAGGSGRIVVAMEWCGQNAPNACQTSSHSANAYIAHGEEGAARLKEFYNYVDMQHGV